MIRCYCLGFALFNKIILMFVRCVGTDPFTTGTTFGAPIPVIESMSLVHVGGRGVIPRRFRRTMSATSLALAAGGTSWVWWCVLLKGGFHNEDFTVSCSVQLVALTKSLTFLVSCFYQTSGCEFLLFRVVF